MNVSKVLCLSLLAVVTPSLLCGATIAKSTWPSEFQNQATTILGYLLPAFKKDQTGVRISYAARCDVVNSIPLIPPVRLQKASPSNSMLEAARRAFRGDQDVIVSRGELDNVRIKIGNAPDDLLRTNIATLRLNEIEQYNPLRAIAAIKATKAMQKAAAALHLRAAVTLSVQLIQQPRPGAPHLPSILQNLTVDQILDIMAARFKGAVLYGVCTKGPLPHQFAIGFFDSELWN